MFQALEPLIRSAGKLTMTLVMDADNVVVFLTPQGGKDATLRQPLILKRRRPNWTKDSQRRLPPTRRRTSRSRNRWP